MKKILIELTILLVLSAFLAPATYAQIIVATVGGKKITLTEFKKKFRDVKQNSINPPKPEVFLEDLIRFEMGVQEAEKLNLRNDPIVQERFKQEMYKALLEKKLGKQVEGIKVNEKEMRLWYKKNPELRLSHILIEFSPTATAAQIKEAKKRANEIYAEVKKSKRPFEELVRLYTDDSLSKNTGGDINYQSRLTIVPPFYETALRMKVGQIKGLVRTQYGYHILKLTGKRSYDQANKRSIRTGVFDFKRKQVFDAYFKKLSGNYKVKRNRPALKGVK
jgi:parvulin-like peptidyl-prolyl isomerase